MAKFETSTKISKPKLIFSLNLFKNLELSHGDWLNFNFEEKNQALSLL